MEMHEGDDMKIKIKAVYSLDRNRSNQLQRQTKVALCTNTDETEDNQSNDRFKNISKVESENVKRLDNIKQRCQQQYDQQTELNRLNRITNSQSNTLSCRLNEVSSGSSSQDLIDLKACSNSISDRVASIKTTSGKSPHYTVTFNLASANRNPSEINNNGLQQKSWRTQEKRIDEKPAINFICSSTKIGPAVRPALKSTKQWKSHKKRRLLQASDALLPGAMDLSQRSNSNPDKLHFSDEIHQTHKLNHSSSLKHKRDDKRCRGTYNHVPRSLPESLEDISMENLLKKRRISEYSEDEEIDSDFHQKELDNDEEPSATLRQSEFRLRDQLYSFFQASDNKLAMKLFGSRNALLREKQRQIAAKTWIIHPCSNFRLYWDLLMLIFLVTNLVVLPVSIAFFYDDIGVHWIVFNITCDTMFILDIVINFRTGLIDNESHGTVILDPKVIALRYLKSWFIIDFVSSLPLDYVFLGIEGQSYTAGRALRILRLAKLLQLLRLLRISRLVRYVRLWQEFFSLASIVVKLFNLICIMVLLGHWSGCMQFFVPVIQGLPDDCWIVIDQIQHAHWWEQYTKSLFKALSHMLSIGYGQYPPRNMTDTWLTIGSMLAGASCYALFIGHATTLIQSFDTSSRQFRDHLQQVNEYMIYRKLPMDLRRRITDYYDHRFGGKMFDEAAILSEISDSLRKDVIYHNCRELIKNVPFFVNADISFVTDVITKLEFEMYQPGDIIVKSGTKGDRMFFIQEGLVEVLTPNGKVVTRLGDGSYFGEISLLTQSMRVATVRAAAYCNLFSLSKEHFDKILDNYPLMKRTLETIGAKRLHTLGLDPSIVTSRESLLDDVNGIQKVFQSGEDNSEEDEEDGAESPTHSKESNSQFLTVVKSFFTKDSEDYSPTSRLSINKAGMSSTDNMHRCKSTLNHLILVPQLNKGLTRRVKSSADFMNMKSQQSMAEFSSVLAHLASEKDDNSKPRTLFSRRLSRSPSPQSRNPEREPTLPTIPSERKFSSQPSTPHLSPIHHRSEQSQHAHTNPLVFKMPEVRIIPQSDASLNHLDGEEEKVKFILDSP